uniref:Putative holin n=1 Tax=viral metagenome TaxID=1070528 RepID=A0A6H2A1Y5_9ZZZZ
MGLLGDVFSGAASGSIKGILGGIGELAIGIRSAITGEMSPEKKADLLDKAAQLESLAQQGQVQINVAEASHPKVFVSGWRPYIGWICGTAIGAYFIPQYLLASVLWLKLCWTAQSLVAYPIAEPKGLMELTLGMLGLAGLRTVEKLAGNARS